MRIFLRVTLTRWDAANLNQLVEKGNGDSQMNQWLEQVAMVMTFTETEAQEW